MQREIPQISCLQLINRCTAASLLYISDLLNIIMMLLVIIKTVTAFVDLEIVLPGDPFEPNYYHSDLQCMTEECDCSLDHIRQQPVSMMPEL